MAFAVLLPIACGHAADRRGAEGTSIEPTPGYQGDPADLPAPVLDARAVHAGGAAPVAVDMANPDRGESEAAKVGERVFSTMNCDGCHGGGAIGWVGPSLVDGRWRYGGADGNIFQSIYYGRSRGMPAYGAILPPKAIWSIVTCLRSQPIPPDVPTESWLGRAK